MQIIGSLSSMPTIDVSRPAFYSDGRPRPVHHDPDEDSHDSFEDGYTTAAQIPASHHFTDPDQPKLLLAEDPVPPLSEKQPLQDGLGMVIFKQEFMNTLPALGDLGDSQCGQSSLHDITM